MKKFITKYWKTIAAAAVVIIAVICAGVKMRNLQADNSMLQHNITALTDTVKTYKTKDGELISQISGYVCEIKDLKKYSEELETLVTKYKKTTGNNVTTAISSQTVTVLPEKEIIFLRDTVNPEIDEPLDFSDEWRTLTGSLKVNKDSALVYLDPEKIHARITAGLDEKQNVFVTTDNPYIQIESLTGFTVPKQKTRRWGLGVQVGAGFNPVNLSVGPVVSIGINYNIITW